MQTLVGGSWMRIEHVLIVQLRSLQASESSINWTVVWLNS